MNNHDGNTSHTEKNNARIRNMPDPDMPLNKHSGRKRRGIRFKWPIIVFFSIVIALAGSGYWTLNTTSGFHWLLTSAARLSKGALNIDEINGTISNMQIKKLQYIDETVQLTVHQFTFNWSPSQLLAMKLLIERISAQRIDIYTAPSAEEDTEPAALPEDLTSPIDISLLALSIDEINLYTIEDSPSEQQPEFTATDFSIGLESNAQQHQITRFSFASELGLFNASGHIQTARPFKLRSEIQLNNAAQWGITQAHASGSLEQLDIKLTHHKNPMQGVAVISLSPFAESPLAMLSTLHARITGFNPAAFIPDSPEMPNADMVLHTVVKQSGGNQLIGQLRLNNNAAAPLNHDGLPLASATTDIQLTEETFKLNNLRILFTEKGLISGKIIWQIDPSIGQATLNIDHLNPAAIDSQLQPAKVNGIVQFTGDADRQQVTVNLSDQALKLNAAASHDSNHVKLEQLELSHGRSSLTGKGELSLGDDTKADNTQPFHFTGQLRRFNIADFVQGPESDLNTRLNLTGHLSPELSAKLDYRFEKSHLNRHPVTGNGDIALSMPLSFNGKAGLQIGSNQLDINGQFGNIGDTLTLDLTAPSLTQAGFGVSGFLKAKLDIKGTPDSPSIDFDINAQKLALPDYQAVEDLSAQGKVDSTALSLTLSANDLQSDGKTQVKAVNFQVTGKHSAHTLEAHVNLDDEITAEVFAEGGLIKSDKESTPSGWQGQLTSLAITGPVPVKLQKPASIKLSDEKISIGHTKMSIAGGEAEINTVFWSPDSWQSDGHFSGIKLNPGTDIPNKENMLHLGGRWHMKSPASLTRLNGSIEITREQGDWYLPGPTPAGIQTLKLLAEARNGTITGKFDLISQSAGEINAQLALSDLHQDKDGNLAQNTPINGRLNLNLPDLSLLNQFTDSPIQTEGKVKLQADIAGTIDNPVLEGNILGDQLAIAALDFGLDLQQGQLKAKFDQSALHIDQLKFVSPHQPPPKDRLLRDLTLKDQPGSLTIDGSLGFTDNRHNLTVALDHLYLAYPSHYWIVVSGKNTAQLIDNTLDFKGEITANAGLIMQPPESRPQLADDVVVIDDSVTRQDEQDTEKEDMIVNLLATLDLGEQFYLRVAGLHGRLDGNLQLMNDEKNVLNAVGSIATRDAAYKAYGQDLTVTRGIVNFNGSLDDPGLNIQAVRQGLEVEAGVEVAGSVRYPKVTLISTPQVPDTEKLSWIVLGRAPDTSGLDTSMLITAATAILGSESGGITGQLSDMLGVDEISFRQGSTTGSKPKTTPGIRNPLTNPTGAANSALSNQVGMVGKRISSRAYLSYERGITATSAGITKLSYSLTPKIKVVTQAGDDSAIDLFYTFKFD